MLQSKLFTKTQKTAPRDEASINAKLLERGGFVYKNSAGVYSFLPLGWRVVQNIAQIVREEMNAIGGLEMQMPALVEKKYWDQSGRWNVEIGFEARGKKEKDSSFVLGWTHEEVLTEIASHYINSYQDLPFAAYQIQTKFRNEPRAKSGLLRGREFIMKDLYSFHASEEDLFRYYKEVKKAYEKIFTRCGLKTFYTEAAGGDFTVSNTHEFQVEAASGEDEIIVCRLCGFAENVEIAKVKSGAACPGCGSGVLEKISAIEVGNIFPLGTKYSQVFGLTFVNQKGVREPVVMGSYGIGVSRLVGAIVEVWNDERGIVWPESVAPFMVHLIMLSEDSVLQKSAGEVYNKLEKEGISVLFDDRMGFSAGEKFADADLIGLPYRLVVSERTLVQERIEVRRRNEKEAQLMKFDEFVKLITNN